MKISPLNPYYCKQFNKTANHNSNPAFGIRVAMAYESETLPNTRIKFANIIRNNITSFPNEYQDILQSNGYKIAIAPSMCEFLFQHGLLAPAMQEYETIYPKDTLSTIALGEENQKYIIFCDKLPYSEKFAKNIVNFALSSALAESLDLYSKNELLLAVAEDIDDINSLKKINDLSPNEKNILEDELIASNGTIKLQILIPDLIAWNLGAGKYGSGLYDLYNPFFTRNLFPKTTALLKQKL